MKRYELIVRYKDGGVEIQVIKRMSNTEAWDFYRNYIMSAEIEKIELNIT